MSLQKLLVIGNGMVGQRLLEYVTGETHDFEITVLCEEPRPAYDRVQLSAFFSGKSADQLSLVEQDFFDSHGITLHLNDKAVKIDREGKRVTTVQGRVLEYDKLVLATGSYPFVPPVPGRRLAMPGRQSKQGAPRFPGFPPELHGPPKCG